MAISSARPVLLLSAAVASQGEALTDSVLSYPIFHITLDIDDKVHDKVEEDEDEGEIEKELDISEVRSVLCGVEIA